MINARAETIFTKPAYKLEPVSSQELEIYPVGLEVNNPGNDSEEVIKKN